MSNFTASLVKLHISPKLEELRRSALAREIPVCDDETLQLLLSLVAIKQPKKVLEIGTAVGLSTIAVAFANENAEITTIEVEEDRFQEAKRNFSSFGVSERITAHLGDAEEFLSFTNAKFDFIFLDGPKAQYEKYLPDLKRLLSIGGVLFSDDVLLFGWVDGKEETPKKRHVIVEKLRSYLETLCADPDFQTSVLDVGDGVAVSVYLPQKTHAKEEK